MKKIKSGTGNLAKRKYTKKNKKSAVDAAMPEETILNKIVEDKPVKPTASKWLNIVENIAVIVAHRNVIMKIHDYFQVNRCDNLIDSLKRDLFEALKHDLEN